jgi:hypothetical protein
MDPYQLARDCGDIGDRPVNPLSLANDIGVLGAYDDARVGGVLLMQANEVAPVQGEDDTGVIGRVGEHGGVSDCPTRFPSFRRR